MSITGRRLNFTKPNLSDPDDISGTRPAVAAHQDYRARRKAMDAITSSNAMDTNDLLWVLGHRIRLLDTDDTYGMIEVTSPPHVPGPPPHFHKAESEFLFIISGTLDVMSDGEWQRRGAGSFVDLPPHTTHTFINNTEEDTVWITGWRPKGFERFFRDFGIPVGESRSQQQSVSESVVKNVVQHVESYGMYLVK
jgi:quercetin dioxygenase-like cupin family protein